jgi:hypothetical protein
MSGGPRWIDLGVEVDGESGYGGEAAGSKSQRSRRVPTQQRTPAHSGSALRELDRTERAHGDVRSALSAQVARVTEAAEESRAELASLALSLLGGAGGTNGDGSSLPSSSSSSSAANTSQAAGSAAALRDAPSLQALGAMVQRVRLCAARLERGSAVSAEIERALSALMQASSALSREEERFAGRAREANVEIFREARHQIDRTAAALAAETADAEQHVRAEEDSHSGRVSELERQTTAALLSLRDAALASPALGQLRSDAAELVAAARSLARGSAPSGHSASLSPSDVGGEAALLEGAASALGRHSLSLQSAFTAQDIGHAAECVQVAAEELLAALPRLVERAEGGRGRVPASLLARVRREERRRELATMDPSRASLLLSHTRQAKAQADPASEEFGKLAVVEEILAIRASSSGSPLARRLSRVAEVWELRRGEFEATFGKLREAAALAEQIRTRAEREGEETAAQRRSRLAETQARRVSELRGWAAARERAWHEATRKDFSASSAWLCRLSSSLAARISASLHILLPLLAEERDADVSAEEGQTNHTAGDATGGEAGGDVFGSAADLLDQRRLRQAAAELLFGEEETGSAEGMGEPGRAATAAAPSKPGKTKAAPVASASASPARAAALASALPARSGTYTSLHTYLLASFELWIDRSVYMLHKNSQGIVLAARSITSRLEPHTSALRRALAVTLRKVSKLPGPREAAESLSLGSTAASVAHGRSSHAAAFF